MGIKNYNPEILPFTFLNIKGKIRGPKNIRMETVRDGEILDYGHKSPRAPSTQLVSTYH